MELSDCCRICLAENFTGQSIFDRYDDKYLPGIVEEVSGIQMHKDDGITEYICFRCAEMLVQTEDIRKKCLDSDAYLRAQLNENLKDSPSNNYEEIRTTAWTAGVNESNSLAIENYSKIQDEELQEELTELLNEDGDDKINEDSDVHYSNISSTDSEEANDQTYSCEVCTKKFSDELTYSRHVKYHTQAKIKCPVCPREFLHKSNLKRHLNIHKDKKPLICDQCGENFNEPKDLYDHIRIHRKEALNDDREEYILKCEVCSEQTASLPVYLAHMKTKHSIENHRPFKCRICNMGFASKQGMYRHIDNIHEDNRRNLRNREKNFLCNTCGKKFHTNYHLQVHSRTHTGERPFSCQYCNKTFSQPSGLKMHTFTHTGEKPFACRICGKNFNQYGHVREHLLTHSEERPHVCKICNHSFRVKGNLTAHMLIHSGKRPYLCSHCGKGFAQNTRLKSHIERSHKEIIK